MRSTKAHRKRHTPSKRTYISFTHDDKAALDTLRSRFKDALGFNLSVALIVSIAIKELAQRVREGGDLPTHPDARVTH
jgi:hypothetical protein